MPLLPGYKASLSSRLIGSEGVCALWSKSAFRGKFLTAKERGENRLVCACEWCKGEIKRYRWGWGI